MLLRNLLFMANANIDRFCFSKNVLAHHEASLNFTTRIVSSMADQVRPQPVGDFKSNQMDPPYSVPLSTDKHLKRIPKTKRVSPIFPGLAFALTALIALQGLLWPGTAVGHPNGQPTNQVAEERGQLERRLAQASVNNLSRADRYRGFDISARTVVQKAVKNLPDAWVSPILKKVTELQTTAPLRGNGLGFHRAGPGHDVVDSISLVNKRGSVDIISTTISVSDKEARPPRNLPQVRRCGSPISPAMITRLRQQLVQAGAQGVIHDESDIYHHVGKSIYAELWKGELAKHGLSMLPRWLSASTRFGGIYCASKGNMWQGVSIQDPDVAHFTLNKGSLF